MTGMVPDAAPDPPTPLVPYDEIGLFHENASEQGLPFEAAPSVRRVDVDLVGGRRVSALVWGDDAPQLVFIHGDRPLQLARLIHDFVFGDIAHRRHTRRSDPPRTRSRHVHRSTHGPVNVT